MKSYNNLPPHQHQIQRLVDQFNADERLWRSLAEKRGERRLRRPRLSAKRHALLDLLEFAATRPPQDCIGVMVQPSP
jgi:hypothetical protein